MDKRTFVGLCAALAFGMGSTAVHALKFVQETTDDPEMADAAETVTYAKETLLKGTGNVTPASDSADKTMYYDIERDHFLAAPPGVASQGGDTYTIKYTLTGMVFKVAPTSPPTGFTHATGGAEGDKEVVYRADVATGVSATDALELTATFAVSADGGSVTMVAENRTFGGMKAHDPAMIKVMPALKAMAMPADPVPQAKAASEFMNFGGPVGSPMLRASVGTFEVGVVTPNLEDAQGVNNSAGDVDTLVDITLVDANPDTSVANPVTFSVDGGFGFVKTLALVDNATTGAQCTGSTLTEIRKAVTPATTPPTYTDETTPQEAQTFELDTDADGTPDNMLQHLCIEVDGETSIPKTGPFMVMATYKGLAEAAFPPMAMMHDLAMIDRDGTQFNIPFLTDDTRFKQRITIQNRGRASTWSLTDLKTVADSVMTLPGMGSGALPMGQTEIRMWEHIDVMGGSRASGSITIPLADTSLTASVDIINPESGSVATTMLMAQ